MSYATRQDMIDRFGEKEMIQLTDSRVPPSGGIDDTVLEIGLNDAKALIDGYLASKYPLPLSEVPEPLTRVACDLARYFLCRKPTEEMTRRYEQSIAWLKDVARGIVSLGLTETNVQPAATGGPQVDAPTPVFTRDTLEDY